MRYRAWAVKPATETQFTLMFTRSITNVLSLFQFARVFCLFLSNTVPLSQVHFQIVPQPFSRAPSIQYHSHLYYICTRDAQQTLPHTTYTHDNHNTYNTRSPVTWFVVTQYCSRWITAR